MQLLNHTRHSETRMQQRCITDAVIDLIIDYGTTDRHRGADITFINKHARHRLLKEMPASRKVIEKALKGYIVEDGGTVITVGVKTKHFKRGL